MSTVHPQLFTDVCFSYSKIIPSPGPFSWDVLWYSFAPVLQPGVPSLPFQSCMRAQSLQPVSDSLRPYRLGPARFLCPWDSLGKNTGVDYHFLLQGIEPSHLNVLCIGTSAIFSFQILLSLNAIFSIYFHFSVSHFSSFLGSHRVYILIAAFILMVYYVSPRM